MNKETLEENCCTPIGQIKRYVDCKGCDRKPKQETLEEVKDLTYWRKNAEEDYIKVPISVLRYITELEERSYSEEDMVKFVSFVGKNYIKAKGFYYMKGDFEKRMKVSIHQIFEQFKKK